MDQPFSEKKKAIAYERFAESLNKLDLNGVELIPQTMAPFPWHFGGQRHQNLFVLHDEIAEWGSKLNLRFCFDVSHSKLACNHFKIDFDSFVQTVAPMTAHLHLGDAKGVNGEGLQIGEGAIDFKSLGKAISKLCHRQALSLRFGRGIRWWQRVLARNGKIRGIFLMLTKIQTQIEESIQCKRIF